MAEPMRSGDDTAGFATMASDSTGMATVANSLDLLFIRVSFLLGSRCRPLEARSIPRVSGLQTGHP